MTHHETRQIPAEDMEIRRLLARASAHPAPGGIPLIEQEPSPEYAWACSTFAGMTAEARYYLASGVSAVQVFHDIADAYMENLPQEGPSAQGHLAYIAAVGIVHTALADPLPEPAWYPGPIACLADGTPQHLEGRFHILSWDTILGSITDRPVCGTRGVIRLDDGLTVTEVPEGTLCPRCQKLFPAPPDPAEAAPVPCRVERALRAASPDAREAFELCALRLTKTEIWHANILNATDEASHAFRCELQGQIRAMRVAMCHILGLPEEHADHEHTIYDYMRGRWDADGWKGWPQD